MNVYFSACSMGLLLILMLVWRSSFGDDVALEGMLGGGGERGGDGNALTRLFGASMPLPFISLLKN